MRRAIRRAPVLNSARGSHHIASTATIASIATIPSTSGPRPPPGDGAARQFLPLRRKVWCRLETIGLECCCMTGSRLVGRLPVSCCLQSVYIGILTRKRPPFFRLLQNPTTPGRTPSESNSRFCDGRPACEQHIRLTPRGPPHHGFLRQATEIEGWGVSLSCLPADPPVAKTSDAFSPGQS